MKWLSKYPGYEVITSSTERGKAYSDNEFELLIKLKLLGYTDKFIGELLNRIYWSVVYKWKEIKQGAISLIEKITI